MAMLSLHAPALVFRSYFESLASMMSSGLLLRLMMRRRRRRGSRESR